MSESLTVVICFFIANALGAIVYGWLLVMQTELPYRFSVDMTANTIFGIGCAIYIWPYIAKITGPMFRAKPPVAEPPKDI